LIGKGGLFLKLPYLIRMSSDATAVKSETAFKHPQCGGLIFMVLEKNRVVFQCDTCLETSEHLEQLAIGKPLILRRSRSNESKNLNARLLED